MKIRKITIENFRSIENETFNVEEIHGGKTYTLIGINESGKSSFLRAVSLVDSGDVLFPKDYFNESKPISVLLTYNLEVSEEKNLKKELEAKGFEKDLLSKIQIEEVDVCVGYEPTATPARKNFDRIQFKTHIFPDYTLEGDKPIKKNPELTQDDFNLQTYFETTLPTYFWKISHHVTFWKSTNEYLINDQIDLNAFSAAPEKTSIPLLNCFRLAGIDEANIPAAISKLLTDPAEVSDLQDKLGDKVTAHIKKVWENHPVKIKFQINNMMLSFLVEDVGVKYDSKTTNQRSDGFRQFVSFLLTISAESSTDQLSYSLLLLDEPETHLHPQAQEYLRNELIKISKNKENNVVIFATHSNYMIDKDHIDRCFRVVKQGNKKTKLEQIKGKDSSYSEVNYEVFGIPTNDYHNELYGYLEDIDPSKLNGLPTTEKWFNDKLSKTENVSLPKYIRNSIHHPENSKNSKFLSEDLVKSISTLRELKYGKRKAGK
ncbi:MAG: AAA family ATPase [Patescibacteria group bacterium]|nr:AAA family ATPase [Patescibacteria group bacterium]